VQPDSGANTEFRKFCDALEVRNGTNAPASGWGLEHALPAWGNYWTSYYIDESELITRSPACRLLTHRPRFSQRAVG
jgi:hypothetical protein